MPVAYNSKRLIPAPFLSISKEVNTTDDGTPIGQTYTLVLRGKLVAWRGSPNSQEGFWTQSGYPPDEVLTTDQWLGAILKKQEALETLFKEDGHVFEVDGLDGANSISCNPRIKRIEFPEGHWAETADYIITMEADCIVGLTDICLDTKISKASEEWNIEILDEFKQTYRLTHSLSAVGKRVFAEDGTLPLQAWENAKNYVLNTIKLGLKSDRMIAPGVLDANSLQAFNYLRAQHVNELGGIFGVTETWLCFDPQGEPPAVEDWTVTSRTAQDGRSSVSIEGTITGLEVRDNNTHSLISTRYTNASGKWNIVKNNLFSRAQTVSGLTLNPSVLDLQVGTNETNGTINYHYDYDDRPTATTIGALFEKITVVDRNPADVFAKIPVLGRALGPVFQGMGTITERQRTVTIEIQMKGQTQTFTPTEPATNALVLSYKPTPTAGSVFVASDVASWTAYDGRYSRNTVYEYE